MERICLKLAGSVVTGYSASHLTESYYTYLGTENADGDLTRAIRAFNLPNAMAPGEWPDFTLAQTAALL